MLGRRPLLALPAILVGARPVWATDAAGQAASGDLPHAVANASVQMVTDEGALEERMDQFIDSSGFGARADRNEISILKGTAPVQVPASNPDWLRYRQIAYSAALLDAQADFVAEQNVRIMARTTLDFFKSANETPPPYQDCKTPGQAAAVLRKLLAVAGGKLDKELQDIGINPKDYENAPEPQRSPMLANHLKTNALKRSFGDTIGLCSVMTFEEMQNGQARIGVVAVTSPIMRDFAQQVLTQQGAFTPDPSHAQDLRQLMSGRQKLISDFGVRRVFDAQGLPAVISFFQWASAYRGKDPAMAATYRDAAARQAEAQADAQLADFLKGSIDYRQDSTVGQEIDRTAESLPDSGSIEDTKRIVDELRRNIVRMASVNITGMRTLKVWNGHHPAAPDQTIIGVVRYWSAAGEMAMRSRQAPPSAAVPAGGASGELQGRKLMDANDF